MRLVALAFWFAAAVNPDVDLFAAHAELRYERAWLPNDYEVFGPYFTIEDCREARPATSSNLSNPFTLDGLSECYATQVSVELK